MPHDRGIVRAINSKYRPNEHVKSNPRHTIFVGRLHIKTDEKKLEKKFRKFGRILRCRVVRDVITGHSKCYGFIEFNSSSACNDAVREMNRSYIHDCEILVEYECERSLKGWKPRRLGGGFGGKRESGQLRFGGCARPFQRPLEMTENTPNKKYRDTERHTSNMNKK